MHSSRGLYPALLIVAACCAPSLLSARGPRPVHAQAPATDTPVPGAGQAYITNTFEGEPAINVRVGPSTIIFPIPCGALPYGASAVALGTTPAREWVQIEHPECPGGVGWLYAANVTLSGALRVVESPATPSPLATATFDPTLAAAFQQEPTVTRLPTFTPPPPLARPTFTEDVRPLGAFPAGAAILSVAILGGLVLAVSFIGRR